MSQYIIMSVRELDDYVAFVNGETAAMLGTDEENAHRVARACAESEQESMVVIRIGSTGVVHPSKPLTKRRPGAKQ